MSQAEVVDVDCDEEEVFADCSASPELRRSSRTSSRKRSSACFATSGKSKPKAKRMSLPRTPTAPASQARTGEARGDSSNGPSRQATVENRPPCVTPGAPLPPAAPGDPFLTQMQAMLAGMEGRLSQATVNL